MKANEYILGAIFFISGTFLWDFCSSECCNRGCGVGGTNGSNSSSSCVGDWKGSFPCQEGRSCCDATFGDHCYSLRGGSLRLTVLRPPSGGQRPSLVAAWAYRQGAEPEGLVQVSVTTLNGDILCFALDKSYTSVEVPGLPDHRDPGHCCGYRAKVTVNIGRFNCNIFNMLVSEILVEDCWTAVGKNRSLEVCGKQIPSAPLNVSAELRVNSSTGVSTIAVNWSPPLHHNSPVDKYLVRVLNGSGSVLRSQLVSPTRTSLVLEERNGTGFFDALTVRVVAAVNLSYWSCEAPCCESVVDQESSSTYYYGSGLPTAAIVAPTTTSIAPATTSIAPATTSLVPTPTTTPTVVSPWIVVGASVVGGVLVLAVCLTAVAVAALALGLRRKNKSGDIVWNGLSIRTVFFVVSTEDSEEVQKKVRHVAHDLVGHGIEAVCYEYEKTSRHRSSPGALGIARWVEHQFQRCDLVLFACTRTFSTEWSRENGDVMIPVVWSSRHVLDGILPHQDDISRFGVVLMGDNCDIPLTLRRFKVFKLFESGSDNLHSDHLIRYVLETPPFACSEIAKC